MKLTDDDVLLCPDDGKRYELIDGESDQPLLPGLHAPLARIFKD